MNTLEIYKAHYEEECTRRYKGYSKYSWASDLIFDLTTYDGSLDEKFVKSIIEVCKVIIENGTYEYIKDERNYVKYILVCQLLDKFRWLDWGTSIRGAWFEKDTDSKEILEEYKWWTIEDGNWITHIIDAVPFSIDNLMALIEFLEE